MDSSVHQPTLGPVVVIGGCGFVGSHIVDALSQDPSCGPISTISRDPDRIRVKGVTYYKGNIGNMDHVRELFEVIKPRVCFHAAAPRADDPTIKPSDHYQINVIGTKNLLDVATKCPETRALVYTSTCAVSRGYQHFNIDETAPLWEHDSKTVPYFKTKALADSLVREASCPVDAKGNGLLTATLRLPWVYGERDGQAIPGMLQTVEEGQTKIQLGNNKNLVEPTYVKNVATAHLLAARKLLESENGALEDKVDGEAFHITDGDPQPFWTFARMIWGAAGDHTTQDQITIIPSWLAIAMARGLDRAYFLFTLGMLRPPLKMSPLYIQYTCSNSTYNIEKARKRLGYAPIVDKEGHIKSSVEWELSNHPERYKKLFSK